MIESACCLFSEHPERSFSILLMADMSHDLTPESRRNELSETDSKRVKEIREALIAEMQERESSPSPIIQEITDLKEDALLALKQTIKFSTNESLKARVSMWTIDKIIDAQRVNDDPLVAFLEGLPDTTSTEEANA